MYYLSLASLYITLYIIKVLAIDSCIYSILGCIYDIGCMYDILGFSILGCTKKNGLSVVKMLDKRRLLWLCKAF